MKEIKLPRPKGATSEKCDGKPFKSPVEDRVNAMTTGKSTLVKECGAVLGSSSGAGVIKTTSTATAATRATAAIQILRRWFTRTPQPDTVIDYASAG
jgi:hypothetical protein